MNRTACFAVMLIALTCVAWRPVAIQAQDKPMTSILHC
jgi:hypothetical protein